METGFDSIESKNQHIKQLQDFLVHAANLLSFSDQEIQKFREKNSSISFMVKELYRNMIISILASTLSLNYEEVVSILSNKDSSSIIKNFQERGIEIEDVISQLNNILTLWGQNGNKPEILIGKDIYNKLYGHLDAQIEKMLGELIRSNLQILQQFAPHKQATFQEVLNHPKFEQYLQASGKDKDAIRQSIFKYKLSDSDVLGQINSAKIAENLTNNAERESVERENLEDLYNLKESTMDGEVIVEISPPIYLAFHKYLMIRIYTRISSGWKVEQYSIPYNENEVPAAQAEYLKIGTDITSNFENYKHKKNKELRRMIKFPTGTDINNQILSEFEYIREYGEIMEKISQVMEEVIKTLRHDMSIATKDLLNNLPRMIHPEVLSYYVKRLGLIIASGEIALADNKTANELFQNGEVSRTTIVQKTADTNSGYNLGSDIGNNTSAGRYESTSECSSIAIEGTTSTSKSSVDYSTLPVIGKEVSLVEFRGKDLKFDKYELKLNKTISTYAYKCPTPKCDNMVDACEIGEGCPKCGLTKDEWLQMAYNEQNSNKKSQPSLGSSKNEVHESHFLEGAFSGFLEAILPFNTKTQKSYVEQ